MATSGTVDISQLSKTLNQNLTEWSIAVESKLVDSVYDTAKLSLKYIKKNTAKSRRKGKNAFRNSYLMTPTSKNGTSKDRYKRTIHSSQYQLAHLLEDGHMVYTRERGHKNDPSAPKLGPLTIKRTYPKSRSLATIQKPTKTSKYEMWKKTEEYASKELYDQVVEKINSINKLK